MTLRFKRDTWYNYFLQNIIVWIVYLSRTNLNHRSFFPRLSLLMLLLVNALCTRLLNYWVLSSFYYVWLICIHSNSSWALLCTLVSLKDSVPFSCIKQSLPLSYFPFMILFYLSHCFTFGIVVCICAGYRVGR